MLVDEESRWIAPDASEAEEVGGDWSRIAGTRDSDQHIITPCLYEFWRRRASRQTSQQDG